MKEFTLTKTLQLHVPLEDVFAFFSDPSNLSRITPEWLNFQIRSPMPVEMKPGTLIDYTIRLHGLPLKWRSRITAWDPPARFVDEQVIGPYRYWIHEHAFGETNGVTTVTDNVRYAVPGGAIVHKLFVARDVERIFRYRSEVLSEIFA